MRQCEKPSPNRQSHFLKTELQKLSVWFLNFEVSSFWFFFSKTDSRHFRRVPHTPIIIDSQLHDTKCTHENCYFVRTLKLLGNEVI